MVDQQKIGFVGLGAMGVGMALSLQRAGFAVAGCDRRPDGPARLNAAGGRTFDSAEDVAADAALLFVMVLNAQQVETVLFGERGAGPVLAAGATVVLCSTVPAGFTRSLATRLAAQGVHLMDAPVSGGAVAAENGELTIMASGSAAAFAAADPALAACAKTIYRLGDEAGIGSTVKAVNQLLAGISVVAAAEGMAFGTALGADPKVLYEVIRNSAGGSWMFNNRVPHMLEDDYTPKSAVDIWAKDLGMVLDMSRELKMPLPIAAAAHQVVMMATAQGLGPIDDAGFLKVYEGFTGAKVVAD